LGMGQVPGAQVVAVPLHFHAATIQLVRMRAC
jgi:hypothetical protein